MKAWSVWGLWILSVVVSCGPSAPSLQSSGERIATTRQALSAPTPAIPAIAAGATQTCTLLANGTVQCWGSNWTTQASLVPATVPGLSGVTAIAGSDNHDCALLSDGTVRCWGSNSSGQVGDPNTPIGSNALVPVTVAGLSGVVAIAASGFGQDGFSCAALSNGTVQCWGANSLGQLGNGTTTNSTAPSVPVRGLNGPAIALAANGYGACALIANRTVQCWGYNGEGELGIGPTGPDYCYPNGQWPCSKTAAAAVSGLSGVTAIASGDGANGHTCALLSDSTVKCWGFNLNGELGDGTAAEIRFTPVLVTGPSGVLSGVTAISVGSRHSCAVLSNGGVQCWGSNANGQLGTGTTAGGGPTFSGGASSSTPLPVPGVSVATAVSSGSFHSCALLASGAVIKCWGDNTYGQLGNGATTRSSASVGARFGVDPLAIAAGQTQTCALLANGTVQCWAGNWTAQPSLIPTTVPGLSGVTAIAGSDNHDCALLSDGTVRCWGSNSSGQVGDPNTPIGSNALVPVTVAGPSGVVAIAASGFGQSAFSCAALSNGTVQCWGANSLGQLGNGTTTNSTTPVPVRGLNGPAIALAANGFGACALIANGTVQCWGLNAEGELGIGPTGPDYCSPNGQWPCSKTAAAAVSGLSGVTAIASGDGANGHTCALLSNGTVKCWGANLYGELGDGTVAEIRSTPVLVSGLSGVTAIGVGSRHSCAVLSNGGVQCWGSNANGQLGTGTTAGGGPTFSGGASSSTPLPVPGVSLATAVSGGSLHSCALLAGSVGVQCWGDNTYGELGNGTFTGSSTPVGVAGFSLDVIPAVYGVATDSAGVTKAIFTYATGAPSVTIPYGQGGNALLDANNAFVASPPQPPPQIFVSTAHPPFVATLTGSALTWQIGTHTATAKATSPQLPTVSAGDGTKDAVLPDGTKVNLDTTPQQPTPTAEPPVGIPDNGVLTGTLQVTPSGAATYTLPIAMAPSVAGMAPNLSLVYNSQGADGIAGQGWSLQGLSVIHKCPRTQQQDGFARPVMMDADPSSPFSNNTDGICLDGQRLFEVTGSGSCTSGSNSGCYVPEKKDFSTITYFPSPSNHFEVKTKAGETRYYGLTNLARVTGTTATAIWALERVNDPWGNFFSVHYNLDIADFSQTGLRVTKIDYTGHMNATGAVDAPTFASVQFGYDPPSKPRPDVRWMRYGALKFPMNLRLTTITTDRGTYTLNYFLDDLGVISELNSIGYCTVGGTCLQNLTFDWKHSGIGSWTEMTGYSLPSDIPTGHGLLGTQFIDLNGDGRSDLVYAGPDQSGNNVVNKAWLNTGSGWALNTQMGALPAALAQASGVANPPALPTGARFADMDGDGILDFIVDRAPNVPCNSPLGCPGVWLNRFAQKNGWEFHSEFSNLPGATTAGCMINTCSTFVTIHAISFNNQTFCDQNTPSNPTNGFCDGFQHMKLLPARLVDINGDGKMDIVRIEEGGPVPQYNAARLEILINQGPQPSGSSNPAWVRVRQQVLTKVPSCTTTSASTCLDFNSQPDVTPGDVNRDGFSDLVREQYYTGPTVNANTTNPLFVFQQVALNQLNQGGAQPFQFGAPRIRADCNVTSNGLCGGGNRLSSCDSKGVCTPFGPQIADLDGDGLYDEVLFGPLSTATDSFAQLVNTASGLGVALNNGAGPWLANGSSDAAGYIQELVSMAPGVAYAEDFAYALADINGDGLPDLIRNHSNCSNTARGTPCTGAAQNTGGGQVLYNNGTTWGSGRDTWQRDAGINALPGVVPSPITAGCGGAFVDLDGDGLVDFIQEEGNNGGSGAPTTTCTGSKVLRDAWTNALSRPVIQHFPNGRASDTFVSYVHITEPAAHTSGTACGGVGVDFYCDDDPVDAGTKKLAAPLLVVQTVSKADGTGINSAFHMVDTTYQYHSLGADAALNGRGPLGFKRVIAYDHASGVQTATTYAQAYPYTGMATDVLRTQVTNSNARLSDTTTTYSTSTFSPPTSLFVFPSKVDDVTTFVKQDGSANILETTSTYQYDAFGNSTQVGVTTTAQTVTSSGSVTMSTVKVTTINQYGSTSGSQEQQQGKVTDVLVSATGDSSFVGVTRHHTKFAYAPVSTFGGASSTVLALAKKEVEPGSGWPVQEDTAFQYDAFGNVFVTTICANDFTRCLANGSSPSPVAFDHPPFRTTLVSFDPVDFNNPTGPGLISSLSYGRGRFPVKVITTTGGGGIAHIEYRAYDPVKGVLLQKTGENGIHTRFAYDDLGRPTSETARCGSSSPIVSTTKYFQSGFASGTPSNAKLTTVARSASGAATWTFSDNQGKTIETLVRSFGGGFIETLTTYNALGQVATVTKPFLIQNFTDRPPTPYQIATLYDGFNRVRQVTEGLGPIGPNPAMQQLVSTTTYNGLSLTTSRTVNGCAQTRTETKNVLGKLQSVVTPSSACNGNTTSTEIDYQYDPDGNLIVARTPASILVNTTYDARGRKTQTTDTDMGTWNYEFDGFGDLVSQADANNQQFVMTYDELGRMLTKQNPATGATAQWIYDTAAGAGTGKLAATVSEADPNFKGPCALPSGATVSPGNRAVKTYTYTGFGDLQAVAECADGDTFQTSYEYDSIGRQSRIHYPTVNANQLVVGYHYTGLGYLQYLSDDSTDFGILWQAKAMNAFGQVIDEQTRNGVETVENRNPGNGWLLGSTSTAHSDGNTLIQNWTYTFDEVGNLTSRLRADKVADAQSSETFTYDALNRLTGASITVGTPVNAPSSSAYDYDANGNLMHKDGKAYTYGNCPGPGRSGSGLHQVCSINGGPAFVYDAAGNLTANGGRTVSYNAHNKAAQIASAAGSTQFMYGADDSRVVQVATSGGTTERTVYVGLAGTGKSMYERTTAGTTITHTNFIYAGGAHGGNAFAVRTNDGATTATRYMSFDHLGSTTAVSDEKGHIAAATGADTQLLGYDAWGARRNPDGQPALPSSPFPSSVGHRDFTGQETIPAVGLINMNGRVYDPVVARFLSPDPDIQTPGDLQNYNRYSYVLNNPLRYTDPTGYDFDLGAFFSNPMTYFYIAEAVIGTVACAASFGLGCVIVGAEIALMNATIALTQGAAFDQTALNLAISVGVGAFTSGVASAALGASTNAIYHIVAGAASAAVAAAITDAVEGRSVGWDVLESAVISAAEGAATFGLQQAMAPSQASGQVNGGGGSGEQRRANAEFKQAMMADKGPDLRLACSECWASVYGEGPLSPEQMYAQVKGMIWGLAAISGVSEVAAVSDAIAEVVAAEAPLIYGPSAGGELAATAARLGGQTLSALEKPVELGWAEFSTQTLARAAETGRQVVFDLTYMKDIPGVLAGTSFVGTITSVELQYIQQNWGVMQNVVQFMNNGASVGAPW